MKTPKLFRHVKHVHMIGIGGAGMSGIAEVLLNLGFIVTGSDLQFSEVTKRLNALGADIQEGHAPEHVRGADVVVFSSAVRAENVEIRAAREARIPTIPRSEMLAELMRLKIGIAISGTHGKTTTTSMVGSVLQKAGLNPTLIVGGIVRALQSGVEMGSGELLIVEADEFDRSFLKLTPTLAVITTIEPEHLDTYTDLAGVQDAFVEFAGKVPFYGSVVVCGDEANITAILPRIKRPVVTYGFGESCRYRASNVVSEHTHTQFSVIRDNREVGTLQLQVPGRHNVLNALAAVVVGEELDVPIKVIAAALSEFSGVHRRFEIKGEVGGVIIVDDYAHHPTEVENTLKTARTCWPERRLVALFQPHLFTRTRDFSTDFGRVLSLADVVLLADIYPARERPIPGVTSELIAEEARRCGAKNVQLIGASELVVQVKRFIQPGDALVVMGAGSITKVTEKLLQGSRG
ncbi:UDP-N-acetylmuramate--L-alanine ligase [candidate division KSB1 bacterium]|nr:MAG: UDP-N-acetylmuramate--L-alanine ligase [candidate division KSB1 bacterium]